VPSEQIVDSGYPTADHLLTSAANHGIDVIGPLSTDHSWQAKAGAGFAAAQFVIDWAQKQAICPQGNTNAQWLPRTDADGQRSIQITFAKDDCAACPVRPQCTQSNVQPRLLQVRDQAHYAVLQAARERQKTALFQAQYTARAGSEGTISQGTQLGDLRRSRYRGLAKTRLLHLLLAAALNFIRVAAWLAETPRARTRQSAFRRLAPAFGEQQPAERGFASGILTTWAIIRVCAGADRWLPDPSGASRFPRSGRRRSVDRLARPACGRGQL
jgi:transposase